MKPLLAILVTLALLSAGAFMYGSLGPWYDPSPLQAPVSLSTSEPQEYELSVDRSGQYLVELELLRTALPEASSGLFLEAPGNGKGADLLVRWSIGQQSVLISEGSSLEHGHSPFRGSKTVGLTIGRVPLQGGETYTLNLTVETPRPALDQAEPNVVVRLHPADLEYLVVLEIGGFMGLVATIVLLGMLGLVHLRRRRNRPVAHV